MKRILIIEDDSDLQDIYKTMIGISIADVEVEQCINGQQGLEAVQREMPDLIILDLLMPVMNGEVFLENLRHKLNMKDVPVIVCSVNQNLAHKLFKEKLVNAVLHKIFSVEELVRTVGKLIEVRPKGRPSGA